VESPRQRGADPAGGTGDDDVGSLEIHSGDGTAGRTSDSHAGRRIRGYRGGG
jgi:hypothetical protein